MKKHVLLGLSLMLFCFISGGIYIVNSFQSGTKKLERIIALHQVEFMRKTLQHNIEVVQSGLLLQDSPHIDNEAVVKNIERMQASANVCQTCHHEPQTQKKLEQMLQNLTQYMKSYSRALTIRANSTRLENAQNLAFIRGEGLLEEVESLSVASAEKISARIDTIHQEIQATNRLLIICLVLGPIAILIITMYFLKRFTGAIDTLVSATQTLAEGDLTHQIEEPLTDEFQTLANAFNTMVYSINAERHKFNSVQALYQALYESAGDAICILDTGEQLGQIISVNPASSRMYGYSLDELQSMNCMQLTPEHEHEKFKMKMLQILDGEQVGCTIGRIRKDGSQFLADISAGPLEIEGHRYILTFARDVTEHLRAQQEMQRANQMALVGEMAAGLAHEIKNPLAGIKVSLDVICDDLDLPSQDKEVFARIIHEISRMERLLKSLLNYARPPVPHFELFDINRLLEYSIKNVAVTTGKSTENPIHFKKDFAADLPQIEADLTQLQQVFLNIYLNAIDAMEKGGDITTVTRIDGESSIWVEISDSGKGLPEGSTDKIFAPFYTTKTKGSGLGLAICKRLIEQHNGTIEVDSHLGEGTSFTISLPLTQKNQE